MKTEKTLERRRKRRKGGKVYATGEATKRKRVVVLCALCAKRSVWRKSRKFAIIES